MNEQKKRKNVIKALECHVKGDCAECPYREGWHTCNPTLESGLFADTLALLKAQEPRVILFDEIDDYEVLWVEVRGFETEEEGLAPWVKTKSGMWFSPLLCSKLQPDMVLSTPDEYGRFCRCWTSRPTDAQREAIPWNVQK